MNSPEPTSATQLRTARAVSRKVRRRRAALGTRPAIRETGEEMARKLDGFAVARICSAFQLKRSAHFPAEMDDAAFSILVDLFLYEWLNQRAGASPDCGMRIEGAAQAARDFHPLVETGLVAVTPCDRQGSAAIITLSRAGRARLDSYFDTMANYISAV